MANYTLTIESEEINADYYGVKDANESKTQDAKYTFKLPSLSDATIKSISVTAPVITTYELGGNGNFLLKYGSTELKKWSNKSITTWDVDNLSISVSGSSSITLDLMGIIPSRYVDKLGRKLGRATATVVVDLPAAVIPESPENGSSINRSSAVTLKWDKSLVNPDRPQTLYWKYNNDSEYTSISLSKDIDSYTFAAGTLDYRDGWNPIKWYVSATNETGTYESPVSSFSIVNDFSLTATAPSDWSKISRSSVVQLKWSNTYIDKGLSAEQRIRWKYSTQSTYTWESVGANDTSYVFNAGTFTSNTTIQWYVEARSAYGLNWEQTSNVLVFQISNDTTVKVSSPVEDAEVMLSSDTLAFKWSNSSIGATIPCASQVIEYATKSANPSWSTYPFPSSLDGYTTSYTVSLSTFSAGEYLWRVISTDTEGEVSYSNVGTFKLVFDYNLEVVSPLDGTEIAKSQSVTFSWTNDMIGHDVLYSQYIYYKINNSTYRTIPVGKTATSYTMPANTFENGTLNWRISSIINSGGIAVSSPFQTITVGITPQAEIAYPNNVNIRKTSRQVFTWNLIESIPTGQTSYEIKYKKDTADEWITITGVTANQYHAFDADTFEVGDYTWKVKVTNADGITSEYVTGTFVAVGATQAPNITNVTNSSMPTFTWTVTSQDTFELDIYNLSNRIFTSGVQVGYNVRTFTPNIMLENGNYIVKMRVMNEYGFFTEWSESAFVISPEIPDPVECMAYANMYHGVDIRKGTGTAYNMFVIRRKYGATTWDVLGKLTDVFTDNTLIKGIKYEYAIRNFRSGKGFSDSNAVSMVIDYQGYLIYNGNEYVELYKTEDTQFDVSLTANKGYSYSNTIGRRFPVKESSEWETFNTSMSCFITLEDYEKLEAFYNSSSDLWFKGKSFSFMCSIDDMQITETLLGKGYRLNINISRTDENEVNLIE